MLKVGASLSLTGRYALQGRQACCGLEAWVRDLNERGGTRLPGRRQAAEVAATWYDDASSRAGARDNTLRLLAVDRVDVLFGPYASDLTREVVKAAAPTGSLVWNHGGSSDEIGGAGARVVSIPTRASRYYDATLTLMLKSNPGSKSAAFLFAERSRFGRQIFGGVEVIARRLGLTVVPITYASVAGDWLAIRDTVEAQGCDLVLSGGAFPDEVELARRLIDAGRSGESLAFVGAGLQEFGDVLGARADGIYAPSQWERDQASVPDFGPAAEAAGRIESAGGVAGYVAAQAYASGLIFEKCLEIADSLSDDALWRAACSLDRWTFFGRFKLDPASGRQEGHTMVTVQWQAGKKRTIA